MRKEGGRRLGARRRSWTAGEPALGPDGGRVGGGGGGEGIYDSGGPGTYGGAQHRSRTAGGSGGAEGGEGASTMAGGPAPTAELSAGAGRREGWGGGRGGIYDGGGPGTTAGLSGDGGGHGMEEP